MFFKWLARFVFAVSFLALTCGIASADHTYYISPASIDTANSWVEAEGVYRETVMGSNAWSGMSSDTFGDGVMASLKIEAAYCPSYCMVRLGRVVGYYNGNRVRVEIRLGKWADNQNILYRIREMDSSGNYLREVAKGFLGADTGQHWAIGETVNLAVAVEGNEFIFHANNQGLISKVQLMGSFTPLSPPEPWHVGIWTETENDSMTATAFRFKAIDVSE